MTLMSLCDAFLSTTLIPFDRMPANPLFGFSFGEGPCPFLSDLALTMTGSDLFSDFLSYFTVLDGLDPGQVALFEFSK